MEDSLGKRIRILIGGEKIYFYLSKDGMMSFFPNESGPRNKNVKALFNFCSRIVSKSLKGKLTWHIVREQLEKSKYTNQMVITDNIIKDIDNGVESPFLANIDGRGADTKALLIFCSSMIEIGLTQTLTWPIVRGLLLKSKPEHIKAITENIVEAIDEAGVI